MRLICVRHGQTLLNREGRVQGHSSVPLTELGRRQAQALAIAIQTETVDAIYSSPLVRARETAAAIAVPHRLPVTETLELCEADTGLLEGLPYKEVGTRHPSFSIAWRDNPMLTAMPNGESLLQVLDRAWPLLDTWRRAHLGQTVVAVTHNFVIQVLLYRIMNLKHQEIRNLRIDLATITEMEWHGSQWMIRRVNDGIHLNHVALCLPE